MDLYIHQTCTGKELDQLSPLVPSVMTYVDVGRPEAFLERGNAEDGYPSPREMRDPRRDRLLVIFDVLQHLEGAQRLVRRALGDCTDVALHQPAT